MGRVDRSQCVERSGAAQISSSMAGGMMDQLLHSLTLKPFRRNMVADPDGVHFTQIRLSRKTVSGKNLEKKNLSGSDHREQQDPDSNLEKTNPFKFYLKIFTFYFFLSTKN